MPLAASTTFEQQPCSLSALHNQNARPSSTSNSSPYYNPQSRPQQQQRRQRYSSTLNCAGPSNSDSNRPSSPAQRRNCALPRQTSTPTTMTRTAATAVTSVGLRAPTRSGNVIEVRTNSDGSRDLEERRSVLDALRRKHGASKSPSSPALESYEERERKERAAAVLDSWERMAMIGLGTGESIPQTRLRYQRKLTNTADPPRTKPTTTLPTSPNSNRVRSSPSGKSVGAAAISTPKPTRKKASSNITSPPQDPQASSPQQSNSNSSPSASSAQDYESEYEESYEATMKIVLEREAVERKRRWDEEERKYNERMEKKERKEREAREQEEREARVARVAKGKEKRDVIGVDVEMGDADQEGEEEDEVLLQGRRRISAGGGALRVERRSLPGGSGGGGGGSLKREKRKKNDVRAGR